ncbi:hypothetical protein [Micromonospora zamorensis]|uniref:hypothetical protein n=1 Tax=Micromonospora zamorensis TaxID=709883 RepID=UPI002E187345
MFTASFLVLLVSALFRWGSGRDAVIGSFFVVAKVAAASLAGSINGGELATGFAVMFAAATRLARTSARSFRPVPAVTPGRHLAWPG